MKKTSAANYFHKEQYLTLVEKWYDSMPGIKFKALTVDEQRMAVIGYEKFLVKNNSK